MSIEVNCQVRLSACLEPCSCVPEKFIGYSAVVEDVSENVRIQILTKQGKPFVNKKISLIDVCKTALTVTRTASNHEARITRIPFKDNGHEYQNFFDPSQGAIFIFWDLEATGLSSRSDHIIQLAACAFKYVEGEFLPLTTIEANGQDCEKGGEFNRFVKVKCSLNPFVVHLTKITDQKLQEDGVAWKDAWRDFCSWIDEIHSKECFFDNEEQALPLVMVSHNGKVFDERMFLNEERRAASLERPGAVYSEMIAFKNVDYFLDTLVFSRNVAKIIKDSNLQSDHGVNGHALEKLYAAVICQNPSLHQSDLAFHSALSDCKAMKTVCEGEVFSTFLRKGQGIVRKKHEVWQDFVNFININSGDSSPDNTTANRRKTTKHFLSHSDTSKNSRQQNRHSAQP
eukprot:GDKJ01025913.1.p1 GENE.GDKJ01025913.1~~GDKJ01025913.1.p1  ORF type:complete len:399 (-),score=69.50 GDKJ01025913.1:50-1246(-)